MKLIIISNRLPVSVTEGETELFYKETIGGLSSGLSSYLANIEDSDKITEYVWMGWPGSVISEGKHSDVKEKLYNNFKAFPVFLESKDINEFYYGFCNKTIWPLFHYFPMLTHYEEEQWIEYKKVNQIFCDAALEILEPGDIVWVHDYQLMLLPNMIREKIGDVTISYFHHIPFPNYEIFRLLPGEWRDEILIGLMGADLIGFHTHDYTQYFLRCVLRILGSEHNMGRVAYNDRLIKADTFPIGIDYDKFSSLSADPEVLEKKAEIETFASGRKIILSIDRLDYTKGKMNRLKGFENFLENYKEYHEKVVLYMVVVPSRIEVDQYKEMKKQIEESIGRINGMYSTINWTPIFYQYKGYDFKSLVALYEKSDIALVTPLRDGMNLVAKEYIASQQDFKGVLILSETAGAAKELGEAIIINPNSAKDIGDAIKDALEMPEEEQKRRNMEMHYRIKTYNVVKWAEDILYQLMKLKEEQIKIKTKLITKTVRDSIIKKYNKSERRVFLLDYDGTLVGFQNNPFLSKPSEKLINILKQLSSDKKNEVVIISGRERKVLDKWLGNTNCSMISEHGAWIKKRGEDWKLIKPLKNEWKDDVRVILERYAFRLPGSFIEEKEYSLVFHYRKADYELSEVRARELTDDLVHFTANIDVTVVNGNKIVEIKPSGMSKDAGVISFIEGKTFDFVMAIGDDTTDEDTFKVLPVDSYAIKVGMNETIAKYRIKSSVEVNNLLEEISKSEMEKENVE